LTQRVAEKMVVLKNIKSALRNFRQLVFERVINGELTSESPSFVGADELGAPPAYYETVDEP